jgi:hypothetical protein
MHEALGARLGNASLKFLASIALKWAPERLLTTLVEMLDEVASEREPLDIYE